MQADINNEYDVRITEAQRRIIARALDEFIEKHKVPTLVPAEEVQEALELVACLDSQGLPLEPQGINDLTPF